MQTLTINGQQYPVKFSYSAIIDFCEKQGIEFYQYSEYVGKMDWKKMTNHAIKFFTLLVYCGLIRGSEASGTELTITENDVMDSLFMDEATTIAALNAILNDMPVKKKKINQVKAK